MLIGKADANGSYPSKPPLGFVVLELPKFANILPVSMFVDMLANGSAAWFNAAGFEGLNVLGVKLEEFYPDGLDKTLLKGSLLF